MSLIILVKLYISIITNIFKGNIMIGVDTLNNLIRNKKMKCCFYIELAKVLHWIKKLSTIFKNQNTKELLGILTI